MDSQHTTMDDGHDDNFVLVDNNDAPAPPSKSVKVVREEITLPNSDESDEDGENELDAEDQDILAALPDETDEIELVHCRLTTLDNLRIQRFSKSLKKLGLRANFLSELPEVVKSLQLLEELDLYDNKIVDGGLGVLAGLPLRVLDLSFNVLRSVPEVVTTLANLDTVYFVQNKITKIPLLQGPGWSTKLRSLELGANRIRSIENLAPLVNLEELWLGKNKISKLQNLDRLKKLRTLSIQSNRITKIEGLEALENLQEFYISHNGLEKIEGLENNLNLTVLDVSGNKIPKVENLSHLTHLKEFWASSNLIPNLHDLEPQLGELKELETIYLEGNPCQRNDQGGYRRKVILALPQLIQLDATFVKQV